MFLLLPIPLRAARLLRPFGFVGEFAMTLAVARIMDRAEALWNSGNREEAATHYHKVAVLEHHLPGVELAIEHARTRLEELGIDSPPSAGRMDSEYLDAMPSRDRHIFLARRLLAKRSEGGTREEIAATERDIREHLESASAIAPLQKKDKRILDGLRRKNPTND